MVSFGGFSRIEIVEEVDFMKSVKTKKVLVRPSVIGRFFMFAASGKEEVSALLIGRIEGEYLVIYDIYLCRRSKGSESRVEMDSEEFVNAAKKFERLFVVGWAHSHPGIGVFMSDTDVETQKDFQSMFPDAVALVLDPFQRGKVSYKFFRIVHQKVKEIEYGFLVRKDDF